MQCVDKCIIGLVHTRREGSDVIGLVGYGQPPDSYILSLLLFSHRLQLPISTGGIVLRHVPINHTATSLLQMGEYVAKAKFSHQAEVASVECSADRERGALLRLGMRHHERLKLYNPARRPAFIKAPRSLGSMPSYIPLLVTLPNSLHPPPVSISSSPSF
jgi:hypothetical protein